MEYRSRFERFRRFSRFSNFAIAHLTIERRQGNYSGRFKLRIDWIVMFDNRGEKRKDGKIRRGEEKI